jgi:PEP-CTERM motif
MKDLGRSSWTLNNTLLGGPSRQLSIAVALTKVSAGEVLRVLLLCAVFMISLAPSARADTTYTYAGEPFTSFRGVCGNCLEIFGSFTVPELLGAGLSSALITPMSFSFSDIQNTLTDTNTRQGSFTISTDARGNIISWDILLLESLGSDSLFLGTENDSFAVNDFDELASSVLLHEASNTGSPGTWTMSTASSAVPEPSSLLLLATGLLSAIGAAHRKQCERNRRIKSRAQVLGLFGRVRR